MKNMNKAINLSVGKYTLSANLGAPHILRNFAIGSVLVCALAGVSSCQNDKPAATQEQTKSDSLIKVNDTLQSQNNAARVQIDEYMTKASKLEGLIQQKDEEIAKLTKEKDALVRNNKKLVSELKANKKLISSLRDELSDTTRSFTERLGLLENDRSNLVRQRDSLMSKYNQVVALGSVLHASNIRLTAINVKRNGKREKDTKRARKADLLRVDFDIDENRIAENGVKKLYLVIKGPDGNLLSSQAAGSGTTTASNGKTLNYSLLKEVPLVTNQPVKDVSADWKEEGDFVKGSYTIDIYNGGYRIGGGKVELK